MLIIYIPVRNLRVRTKFEKKELRTIFLSDFRFQTRLNNLWSCVTLIFIIWWIYSHCVFKSFGSITVKTCMSVMYSDMYVVYPKNRLKLIRVKKAVQWFWEENGYTFRNENVHSAIADLDFQNQNFGYTYGSPSLILIYIPSFFCNTKIQKPAVPLPYY